MNHAGVNLQLLCRGACRTITFLVTIMCLHVACGSTADEAHVGLARPVPRQCDSKSSDHFFFPPGTWSRGAEEHLDGDGKQFSAFLAAMDEPTLSCGGPAEETYRLLWSPSLAGESVAIRITHSDSGDRIVATWVLNSAPAKMEVVRRVVHPVVPADWQKVHLSLERADFWFAPIWKPRTTIDPIVFDSATSVVEG